METELKGKMWRYIKDHPGQTAEEIAAGMGITVDVFLALVRPEVDYGWIEVDNWRYYVRWKLDRPYKFQKYSEYDYEKMPKGPAQALPDNFLAPEVEKKRIIQHFQGRNGTCVGQCGAHSADINYVRILDDTLAGKSEVKRDQMYGTCKYDLQPGFSAACAYQWSREESGIDDNPGEGSYVWAMVKTLYKRGNCLNDQWYNCKGGGALLKTPYPASNQEVITEAAKHKIEGYSTISAWDTIKQTIYEKHFVPGAIAVYSNYSSNGKNPDGLWNGNWPDPKGDIIGYHALCFVGWTADDRLLLLHSWEGWTWLGSISKKYYLMAAEDFHRVLDENETRIGDATFKKVNINANVPATIFINKQEIGTTPVTTYLKKGTYNIEARATGYVTKSQDVVVESDMEIMFDLVKEEPEPPLPDTLLGWIIYFLKKILDIFRGPSM